MARLLTVGQLESLPTFCESLFPHYHPYVLSCAGTLSTLDMCTGEIIMVLGLCVFQVYALLQLHAYCMVGIFLGGGKCLWMIKFFVCSW